MLDFIMGLNVHFTDEEKEACLPVIEKIMEYATIARTKGLLALEGLANQEENAFLQAAIMYVVDANDPDKVREWLQLSVLANNRSGCELLSELLILEGVMCISSGTNLLFTRLTLAAMLGEKYISLSRALQKAEEEKNQPIENFKKSLKDSGAHEKYRDRRCYIKYERLGRSSVEEDLEICHDYDTAQKFDFLFYCLCQMNIQSILREVDYKDLLVIFTDGNCDRNTYIKILDSMAKSKQLELIADVEITPKPETEEVTQAQERIIETIIKLDKRGYISI
jgi:hypothetical protein